MSMSSGTPAKSFTLAAEYDYVVNPVRSRDLPARAWWRDIRRVWVGARREPGPPNKPAGDCLLLGGHAEPLRRRGRGERLELGRGPLRSSRSALVIPHSPPDRLLTAFLRILDAHLTRFLCPSC